MVGIRRTCISRTLSPLAVSAALFLMLAGPAHAFTVEIVEPEDALCALALGRDYDFEAVAYDSLQQDITSQVTWSWDFGDGSAEDDDNPATHQFDDPATCTVTVTGDWNAQQAQDTVTVQALPEWIADSVLYVRPAGATHLGYGGGDMVFDGEVCDMVEVVWETDEIGIHSARFYVRNGDGSISWISDELQPDVYQPRFYGGQGPDYEQAVSPEIMTAAWFPNQTKTYGVRIGREYGTPDGPEWEYFDRDIAFTSNNTAVAGNTGLIVHKEGSAPHQITWTIEHRTPCAVQEPATGAWSWDDPEFIVTVAILDLWGNVHDTIACGSANGVGAGSTTWNGGTEYGIYTYHISAEHTQVVECSDQDKSPRLTVSNVGVTDFEWIDLPTTAQVTLGYQLNRASANCRLRVFNHELDEVTVTAPAGGALSNTVGTHSLTVQFEDPDQIVGNYRFVVLADETANDGALNRDEQPKPALTKGGALTMLPPAFNFYGGGEGASDFQSRSSQISQLQAGAEGPQPAYNASSPVLTSARALYERWEAQSDPTAVRDAVITYVGHGSLSPDHPQPAAYSFLSLDGQSDGLGELRGGRPADNPQNSSEDDVYYISNLPSGALGRTRLVLLMSCYGATHTAPHDDWDDLLEYWEGNPGACGCVAHAMLAKGAQCVVGFQREVPSPGLVWSKRLWQYLASTGPERSVANAASWADATTLSLLRDTRPELADEIMAKLTDRYVGGDAESTIRPARWAD